MGKEGKHHVRNVHDLLDIKESTCEKFLDSEDNWTGIVYMT